MRSAPSISIYLPTNYRNIAKNTQYCQFSTYWGNYLKRAPCALFASHIPVSSSFSGRTNHSLSFPLSPLVKRESEREGKREREKERESDGRSAPISQPPFSPGRVMGSPDAGAWCCSPRRAMNLWKWLQWTGAQLLTSNWKRHDWSKDGQDRVQTWLKRDQTGKWWTRWLWLNEHLTK